MEGHDCGTGFSEENVEGGVEDGQPFYIIQYTCLGCGSTVSLKRYGALPE